MSAILLLSIVIRIAAVLTSLEAMRRLKDWRIGLLALIAGLMALRQMLTLFSKPVEFSLEFAETYDELPGLAVSVLFLASVVFLYRLIRDRDRAHVALASREAQLQLITDTLPVLLSYIDRDLVVRYANRRHTDWFGVPVSKMVDKPIREVIGDDAVFAKCEPFMRQALAGEVAEYEVEEPFPDGKTRLLHIRYLPHSEAAGEVCGFLTLVEDITEKHRTEEQLVHSQRMQAIGQLTGGVAHDFNNLLAVIQGSAEFLGDTLDNNKHLEAIGRAGRRGAELTQRLLAFSRQQPLRPETVDVSASVFGMEQLLKRTLGESIDIAVSTEPGLWQAMADPGQVENSLLNLAINARDAMPGGGSLTIECANVRLDGAYAAAHPEVQPGEYVSISVRDTGAGMPPEILERVFEPFYTTKEVGEGSGLGLSMVYGFAQQSRGYVKMDSQVGVGTTAHLYLPRAKVDVAQAAEDAGGVADLPRGQGEIILVLEDDPEVRKLAVGLLNDLGYTVFEAADAHAAEATLSHVGRVDVVLSDIVLPGGVSGPDFVDMVLRQHPGTRALYMSGYTANVAKNNGFLTSGAILLNKPFQRKELAEAVQSVLRA